MHRAVLMLLAAPAVRTDNTTASRLQTLSQARRLPSVSLGLSLSLSRFVSRFVSLRVLSVILPVSPRVCHMPELCL